MNELQIFRNSEFGEFNILIVEGKEYFPATECARILGYANPQEAIRAHCKGVREFLTPTKGGEQNVRYIPEGDLLRLIVRSHLPAAQRFESWVFDEILPSIRKTGSYSIQPMTELQILRGALDQIEVAQRMALEAKEEAAQANQRIQVVKDALLPSDKKWRQWVGEQLNRIVRATGYKHDEIRHESYDLLEKRAECKLSVRLKNLKERLFEAGASKTAINNANRLDVIEADTRLKEIYSSIVRELVIKHVA